MIRKPLTALGLALVVFAPGALGGCSQSKDDKVNVGVSAIIFQSRATMIDANGQVTVNVSGGNGQVIDYLRYMPGGSLSVLMPARPDGKVYNLTKDFPEADINGLDVSFDAKQAVFAMKKNANDHYHIYTINLEGLGNTTYKPDIHQLTAGDYDDFNPIYMAGRKIVFATNQMYTAMGTRADEYEHSRVVSQLASITVDGGDADRRLFSQNLSHTVAPFSRADGKLGYSRWEHLGPVNDVKVFAANPDGTQMVAVSGQHDKPGNSLVNIREIGPNQMVGIVTTRNRTIHAGSLLKIDSRNQSDPVCLGTDVAAMQGHACVDEEHAKYELLTPDVPTGNGPSPAGRYREPNVLPDGRLLVSWADGPVNDVNEQSVTPPDFGIYVFDPKTGKNQLVYNDRSKWDLGATPIAVRPEPPVIGDAQTSQDSTIPARIGSVDVSITSLNETVNGAQFNNVALRDALKQATKVRILEGFSSEAAKGVTLFGLTMHEGAAILGEAPVNADGSWLADIPAYIPFHLQPLDKFGLAIRSQGLWIQAEPGENRRCVGCHESRVGIGVPRLGQNPTVAEQKCAPGSKDPQCNYQIPIDQRVEYPWNANDTQGKPFIQDILTKKCASCHNASMNGNKAQEYYTVTMTSQASGTATQYRIPRLDLSDTPITVYYDRRVQSWNASYVSIFYPATIAMGGPGLSVMGNLPPMWGVPADARGSKLIEKMNVKAPDNTTAWNAALHPEDVGVTLTDEERQALIRSFDMGGQYYARQNTGFKPFTSDPTNGQSYK